MSRVIADETMKAQLKDFAEFLEICDASGRVVGHFQPVAVHDREVYDWAKKEFTEEELELARQSPEWYTTEQVLEYLQSL